jgi:site-specific recombinase XerD
MSEDVVKVNEADLALVVPSAGMSPNARLVTAYVAQQVSRRSKTNALDSLRRVVRLVMRINGVEGEPDPFRFEWTKLDYEHVMLLRSALAEMVALNEIVPGTANLTLSHLRSLIATAAAMRLITPEQFVLSSPKMVKSIRAIRKRRGQYLSFSDERILREATARFDEYLPIMLDAAIVLAIGGGLRRDEVAGITIDRIKDDRISVIGKGNKERVVMVDRMMQRSLDQWIGMRTALAPDHDSLFCSPTDPDVALSAWCFWLLVRQVSHYAFGDRHPCKDGCKCFDVVTGPHDFRRTFASRLLKAGLDITEVQKLMGHESVSTTALYDKRSEEELREKRLRTEVIA